MDQWVKSSIPLQMHRGCIIASFQLDLDEKNLKLFRQELLNSIVEHNNLKGIIFDLSGLEIIDLVDFQGIKSIISMIKLTGFETVISGLKPAVVSSLILMDADVDDLNAALNLDEAYVILDNINRLKL
ncbi:STAS domain-containing protein [Flammeovirga sp. SubArs3]|uniref:STAS domain-containing protein n=1 Tax=Flammeovirga sp. SubArs3 TaxID=2995316 RepID=UPI00248B1614|nr:STAS domain-containing protein [Flammeovirga sp. SubArs3]